MDYTRPHRKTATKEHLEKEIYRQQDLGTVGERWKWQQKMGAGLSRWSMACVYRERQGLCLKLQYINLPQASDANEPKQGFTTTQWTHRDYMAPVCS